MESIQHLYELLNKSSVTVLGYNTRHEIIKDELISRLSHSRIGEVSSSFCVKQALRDIKLNQVLNNGGSIDYLVLDTMDIHYDKKDDKTDTLMSKSKAIGTVVESIRSDMYEEARRQEEASLGLDFDDPTAHQQNISYEPPYKLLLTSPLYRSMNKDADLMRMQGGSRPIYMADLVLIITGEKEPYIKIAKNRDGHENKKISLEPIINQIERDRKINKVLLSK